MKNQSLSLPKIFYAVALICLSVITQSSSCSRNDDIPANTISNADYSGSWKLTMYFDDTDETYKFNGYTFLFTAGGVLTASNGSNTVSGTWSLASSKLIINFGVVPDFEDLNDDWLIVEKTATTIKLKDDNPARNEKLEFIKL